MRCRALETAKNLIRQYGWKGFFKAIRNKLMGRDLLDEFPIAVERGTSFSNALKVWENQRKDAESIDQRGIIDDFELTPLISVIMPIYNAPPKWLNLAVEALLSQTYENWELVAVNDGSKDKRGVSILEKFSQEDARIRLIHASENGGISAASNIGLKEAKGEYIALMDQDDEIPCDAFFWMVSAINENPDAEWLYSDECKVQPLEKVEPCEFILKPDWSPEFLYNSMYTGHLSVYRKSVIEKVGGFRSKFDFSQDYDLALRLSEVTEKIVHVERILYYWRMIPTSGAAGGKDFARISNVSALADAFKRKMIHGNPEMHPLANRFHPILEINPLVSIVIPSDSTKMLKNCIEGLLGDKTSYKNIEIIAVTNSKTGEEIEGIFAYTENVRICAYDKVYNFSDKCNEGVKIAKGEYVIIYNDDVYPFSYNWIEALLEIMQYPGVGGASPVTLYENDTIQYAGMITGVPGMVGTAFNGLPFAGVESTAFNHFLLRDVSVLCGACMIMRRDLYLKIGGFDAVNTPTGHSDVDISFKIREQGLRCVYTSTAGLVHIGNHSWANKKKIDKSDIFLMKRWGKYLEKDPYFSDTMRKVFYRDVVHNFKIYMPENMLSNKKGKDILILSHELTRTGAPIVLKSVVRFFLENGDWPVLASPVDGPLKNEFLKMGIPVIIDEGITNGHWSFEHFARNFDLVFANTLAVGNAISQLSDSLPRVIWWIHESEFAINVFQNMIPKRIGNNISVYTVSEYVERLLEKRNIVPCGNLAYGVDDFITESKTAISNKKMFVVVGSVENRKGQDIAIKAFLELPEKIRCECELLFIGQVLDNDIEKKIMDAAGEGNNVKVIKPVEHDKVMQLFSESTAVLVPSRDDPLPVTATEAFILGKPCIVSDHTGTASFITDGVDGFIFENEDEKQLKDEMLCLLNEPELAYSIGKSGRKLYENNFTYNIFAKKLSDVLEQSMKK